MKKMLMMGAAMVLAATLQAAQVNWSNSGGTSAIYGLDGTTKITSTTAGTYSLVVSLVNVTDGATVQQLTGSAAISSMTAGQLNNAIYAYSYGTGASATGNGDNFYVLLTANFGGTDYTMKVYENNTSLDYWTVAAADDTGAEFFVWTAGTYGGTGTTGDVGKWVAVPEPTSMALLALGVAAIGLRRKFRA